MAAYKDEQRGTWCVSFHYYDWTWKNCRKVKRGFKTKREAAEWKHHFRMKEAADLDITFGNLCRHIQEIWSRNWNTILDWQRSIYYVQNYCRILNIRKCVIFVQRILSSGRMNRFPNVMKKESPIYRLIRKLCNWIEHIV